MYVALELKEYFEYMFICRHTSPSVKKVNISHVTGGVGFNAVFDVTVFLILRRLPFRLFHETGYIMDVILSRSSVILRSFRSCCGRNLHNH